MPEHRRTFTRILGITGLAALVLAMLKCGGPANVHDMGEICNPYAQGTGTSDASFGQGDCKAGLLCACAQGPGCECSVFCGTTPDAAVCQPGYDCISARNVITQETNTYCFIPDGGT
jgi:hypothetical protein